MRKIAVAVPGSLVAILMFATSAMSQPAISDTDLKAVTSMVFEMLVEGSELLPVGFPMEKRGELLVEGLLKNPTRIGQWSMMRYLNGYVIERNARPLSVVRLHGGQTIVVGNPPLPYIVVDRPSFSDPRVTVYSSERTPFVIEGYEFIECPDVKVSTFCDKSLAEALTHALKHYKRHHDSAADVATLHKLYLAILNANEGKNNSAGKYGHLIDVTMDKKKANENFNTFCYLYLRAKSNKQLADTIYNKIVLPAAERQVAPNTIWQWVRLATEKSDAIPDNYPKHLGSDREMYEGERCMLVVNPASLITVDVESENIVIKFNMYMLAQHPLAPIASWLEQTTDDLWLQSEDGPVRVTVPISKSEDEFRAASKSVAPENYKGAWHRAIEKHWVVKIWPEIKTRIDQHMESVGQWQAIGDMVSQIDTASYGIFQASFPISPFPDRP